LKPLANGVVVGVLWAKPVEANRARRMVVGLWAFIKLLSNRSGLFEKRDEVFDIGFLELGKGGHAVAAARIVGVCVSVRRKDAFPQVFGDCGGFAPVRAAP